MTTIKSKAGRDERGFTMVELLVVMLILGLLAAIAIPSFFSQRDKAKDAEAKGAARSAQTAIEIYATENDGAYDGATLAKLKTIEPILPDAPVAGNAEVGLELADTDGTGSPSATGYRVTVTSTTGSTFSVARAGSTFTFPCTSAGSSGCSGTSWN